VRTHRHRDLWHTHSVAAFLRLHYIPNLGREAAVFAASGIYVYFFLLTQCN
jgi:hypothetical protein